jgi:hypothetical protein
MWALQSVGDRLGRLCPARSVSLNLVLLLFGSSLGQRSPCGKASDLLAGLPIEYARAPHSGQTCTHCGTLL